MWRDQIDPFWDGRRALALGFFAAETARETGLRHELVVVSARDPAFVDQPTLVDVIAPERWRCGHCILSLPSDHAYVSLRSPDGAELRLTLASEQATLAGGEYRLLLAEFGAAASERPVDFKLVALAARGNSDRLAQDRIARGGAKLVWAIGQTRVVERRAGAAFLLRLSPAQLLYPADRSRIVVEAVDDPGESVSIAAKAPFAIMEAWLREPSPPCASLRIQIPAALEGRDAILGRIGVFHVLNQRRRARQWIREQKFFGEPTVELLTFGDIRRAVGRAQERPDAVESGEAIVVHNLMTLLSGARAHDSDGVTLRRLAAEAGETDVETLDLEFYAAALGDEIGLIATIADVGDIGALPVDPGGSASIRLFRLENDGLQPRRIDDKDLLLAELLRLAAQTERTDVGLPATAPERGAAQGQRDRLLVDYNSALAAAGFVGRIPPARSFDNFELLSMSAFVALARALRPDARAMLMKLGGYEAYVADPPLVEALTHAPEFARQAEEASFWEHRGASRSIVHRVVGAARVPGLVVGDVDLATQIRIWRLLTQAASARKLTVAGIALSGQDDVSQAAFATAETLLDVSMVERAAVYCDALDAAPEAELLRSYLARRAAGAWTSLDAAIRLAAIVEESNAYWRGVEQHNAAPVEEPPPPSPPEGVFGAVRRFFTRGRRDAA